MLDGLDDISWQSLRHAYGSASDVPVLLRALAVPGPGQEAALYELFGNIWHQGTVYEASSYAVPFLVELAAEPGLTRRDEILGLIGALANGKSYLAANAQVGSKTGDFFRKAPDFEKRLEDEQISVRLTRGAILERLDVICRLLRDATPMVRVGAAHVISQFPEQVSIFGAFLRLAAKDERDELAQAGMVWCLGAVGDTSPEAQALLNLALASADPRQAFAAAVAWYRVRGELCEAAFRICRQMAAATWFANAFLAGVPWDFTGESVIEPLLAKIEPNAKAATRSLLTVLKHAGEQSEVYPSIVHDLLQLNFAAGNWRECARLTRTQNEILRSLVETETAWQDAKRLWFLVPNGAVEMRISEITVSDIEKVRNEMRALLV
jgi:hypothetical protein